MNHIEVSKLATISNKLCFRYLLLFQVIGMLYRLIPVEEDQSMLQILLVNYVLEFQLIS